MYKYVEQQHIRAMQKIVVTIAMASFNFASQEMSYGLLQPEGVYMQKGISLHIGLNRLSKDHYDGWEGILNACVNDANSMQEMANKSGFQANNILTDDGATREAVINGISNASKALEDGDYFFLTYSGHGGQVPDQDGEELDGQDETWCLFDGQLFDDEIYQLLGEFKVGVRVLVLSDSCHSGTVVKELFPELTTHTVTSKPAKKSSLSAKTMPVRMRSKVYLKNKAFYDKIIAKRPKNSAEISIKASIILISGCQDDQLSFDGEINGAFTKMVLQVWNNGKFDGSIADFYSALVEKMGYYQVPNLFLMNQNSIEFSKSPFLSIINKI